MGKGLPGQLEMVERLCFYFCIHQKYERQCRTINTEPEMFPGARKQTGLLLAPISAQILRVSGRWHLTGAWATEHAFIRKSQEDGYKNLWEKAETSRILYVEAATLQRWTFPGHLHHTTPGEHDAFYSGPKCWWDSISSIVTFEAV
jgi:hypothetical protein